MFATGTETDEEAGMLLRKMTDPKVEPQVAEDVDQKAAGQPEKGDRQQTADSKLVNTDQPPVQPAVKSDKWAAALERLSHEDRERFSLLKTGQRSAHEVLVGVLEATRQKKDECMKKRWKVVIKGRTIILRDVLEKLSVWVSKIVKFGDIAIQYDPVHAALPWAAIRLILQATVNDVEVFGWVLQSIESIANLIATCSIFELRYTPQDTSYLETGTLDQLSNALVSLYATILRYLTAILHHYSQGSAIRFAKSMTSPVSDFEAKYAPIQAARDEAWSVAQLAEAEKSERILATLSRIESSPEKAAFETLDDALKVFQEPIARAAIQLAEIHDGLERDTRARILKSISSIPYTIHHKNARKGRLEGSGKWLLAKPEYRSWRQSSSSSVLWLHGIPGCGKTKLTSLVIDELGKNDNLAYFYCMRNPAEPQRGKGEQILASLVRQLAGPSSDKPILLPVVAQYEDAIANVSEFEDQAWTVDESRRVLLELMGEYPSATIVLDALDEVNQEDRQELLDILSGLLQESPNLLKIFISSRDNYEIALHFEGSPNVYIDADDNAGDIASFIDNQLKSARLLHNRLPKDLEAKIVETLHKGASGMFRWVDLQIQSLRPLKVAADIEARLGVLPATLEGSYWEIYQMIQESGDHAAALADLTFQWLMYAVEPVTAEVFAAIASSTLPSGTAAGFTASEVIDVCSNLIVSRHGSFEFAHLSVREFFEGLHKRNHDKLLPVHSNWCLATACLRLLHDQIEVEIPKRTADPKATAVLYATQNWVHHVCQSCEMRTKDPLSDLIKSFLVTEGSGADAQVIVSKKFEMWCRIMKDKGVRTKDSVERKRLEDSFADPPNPIWLACLYDWSEILEFLYTAKHKDIDEPRRLQSFTGYVDTYGSQHMVTPLGYVLARSKTALMEIILSHCADPLQLGAGIATTPLTRAAQKGDEECIKVLLKMEHEGLDGVALAFSEAAANGHRKVLEMLLAHNGEVLSAGGYEAMRKACIGGSTDVVKFLFDKGFHATTDQGSVFLYRAVIHQNREVLEILLEREMGLKGLSKALILAISNDDEASTTLLLSLGARKEPAAVTRMVKTGSLATATRLIGAGYDISGRYLERRRTPLHYAAEQGYQQVVSSLLSAGAPVNVYDGDRNTPLCLAAAGGHDACVELLLRHRADVLAEDAEGRIPLDLAEMKGHGSTEAIIRSQMLKLMEELLKEREALRKTKSDGEGEVELGVSGAP